MRKLFVPLLLVALALPVLAGDDEDKVTTDISVNAAVQTKNVDKDSSKAEEYGNVPDGFYFPGFKINFGWKDTGRYMKLWGKNIAVNNARYGFNYGDQGKYDFYVTYNKIPHLFSKSGVTIWTETSPGHWSLPDSLQKTIQDLNPYDPVTGGANYAAAFAKQRAYIANLLTTAHPTDLSLMRNRGKVGFTYNMNSAWKANVEYFRENREGTRPIGTSFGFSWITELPETIDYNTNRVHAGIEYAKNGTTVTAAYDGNIFKNDVTAFIWDNPYRITDRTYPSAYSNGDGAATARFALPPANNSHMISFGAGANVGSSSRVTGSFSYTNWSDDVQLLPFTTNTAITAPLTVNSFQGKLTNTTLNLGYNAHFGAGNFTARYRLYDQKNKDSDFSSPYYVRFDGVFEDVEIENELFAWKTQNFDLDLGYNLGHNLNWHASYSYGTMDRVHRDVAKSKTNSFKTSIDANSGMASLRFSYQYQQRRWDEYDFEGTYGVIGFARFDEANVNQNLLKVSVQLSPNDKTGLGAYVSYGKDDYVDSPKGVTDGKNVNAGFDFSYEVAASSSFGLYYDHTQSEFHLLSRQSGASASTNPLDDWTAAPKDKWDTVGVDFTTDVKKDSVSWNIDVSHSKATGDVPLTSPAGGTPNLAYTLPNSDNTQLTTARTGLKFKLSKNARIGVGYSYERYKIDDFDEEGIRADYVTPVPGTGGTPTVPGAILLNAIKPAYTYNVGWISLSYGW